MVFRRSRRNLWILVLFFAACVIYSLSNHVVRGPQQTRLQVFAGNYFEETGTRELLVDTPNCTIPYDRKSEEKQGPDKPFEVPNCDANRPRFTYLVGNRIFINESFSASQCCFKGIIRVKNDDEFKIVDPCNEIDPRQGTLVEAWSNIIVICRTGGKMYDDYQFVVQPGRKSRGSNAPSIAILGIDSVSRHYFHSMMPKTHNYLLSKGAFEFLGHTKVGSNTFPNMIPMLTGYSEAQVSTFCYNRSHPFDDCPLIWNDLNMNTAYIEDAPFLGAFNYFKAGFRNSPTSHYSRPTALAAAAEYYPVNLMFDCIGSRPVEHFILDTVKDVLEYDAPAFTFSWMTNVAHEGTKLLPYADDIFLRWISSLNLTNTIFILMSDHGHRFGPGRASFNGWYNDKLPFLTITLPEKVKKDLGEERLAAMKSNERKLTTPFDFYNTLVDILKLYNLKDFVNSDVSVLQKSSKKQDSVAVPARLYGQSLFTRIPADRTCESAGIPSDNCACVDMHAIDVNDSRVEVAAVAAVKQINSFLLRRCRPLELAKVTGSARLGESTLVVGFIVSPGGFEYEAYFDKMGESKKARIKRTSKIHGVWCIQDWFYEEYCYCDLFGYVVDMVFGSNIKKPS